MTKRRTATTAAAEYATRRAEIAALIEDLGAMLAGHDAAQKSDPLNWGFVGDLDHVAELLRRAIGNEE